MSAVTPQPCLYLPTITERRPASALAPFRGKRKGSEFYHAALECAQSRWLEGFPAQAILMINRALSVDFARWRDEERAQLSSILFPYRALAFIIREGGQFGFLGNPRRHFQHLATRMSGPHRELRIARAWACWAIARKTLPYLIADEKQLIEEDVVEPTLANISTNLAAASINSEYRAWVEVLDAQST